MKKVLVLSALLVLMAGVASADNKTMADSDAGKTLRADTPQSMVIGRCSKGVKVDVVYDTAGTAYAMQSVHLSGSKIYGVSYDTTAIYVQTPSGIAKDIFTANPLTSSIGATAFPSTKWSTL